MVVKIKRLLKEISSWIKITIVIFLVSVAIKVFVAELFYIPSNSMENTLEVGDMVLVSKLNYGARLPQHPMDIPWLNLIFYFTGICDGDNSEKIWDFNRIRGFSSIESGDVIVFNHVDDYKTYYIKRCIAISGDTIEIKDGSISINSSRIEDYPTLLRRYDVKLYNFRKGIRTLYKYQLPMGMYHNMNARKDKIVTTTLSTTQLDSLRLEETVESITPAPIMATDSTLAYPYKKEIPWSIDNFGPLFIPSKGSTIEMNRHNLLLYRKIIRKFEKCNATFKEGKLFIDGTQQSSYTFKHNYYFAMGDNRYNSADSRIWGMLPEENIVGKAVYIAYSKDKYDSSYRWDRTMKQIK